MSHTAVARDSRIQRLTDQQLQTSIQQLEAKGRGLASKRGARNTARLRIQRKIADCANQQRILAAKIKDLQTQFSKLPPPTDKWSEERERKLKDDIEATNKKLHDLQKH
jgi:hypothetical protein